jgi:hypothetical protein
MAKETWIGDTREFKFYLQPNGLYKMVYSGPHPAGLTNLERETCQDCIANDGGLIKKSELFDDELQLKM